jgi:hypothetical protein
MRLLTTVIGINDQNGVTTLWVILLFHLLQENIETQH